MMRRIHPVTRRPSAIDPAELTHIRGGDGNPGTPGTDGGIAQMEKMMDQQNAMSMSMSMLNIKDQALKD
jgi:hypothetical protein